MLTKIANISPKSFELLTATSRNLTNVDQTQYVINDEPATSQDSNISYPIPCRNGKEKFILQTFDKGHEVNITPLTFSKSSFKGLVLFKNRFKQK